MARLLKKYPASFNPWFPILESYNSGFQDCRCIILVVVMFDLLQVEYKDIFLKKSKIYLNLNL